ncbi:MAG: 16S rRNA (uracil(1498)-N(3))-methyltransferase [Bacteroidetes bacterium]|nr:16S rRNA (uracil(1498)-N(3))-methyltransferase [Bacteroidota bacterium]
MNQTPAGDWVLDAAETRHCYQVLRHVQGDTIHAVDGLGYRYQLRLGKPGKTHTPVTVLARTEDPHEHYGRVEVAFPLLKHTDRIGWLVEKATELGATALHPLLTARCERKTLDEERLQRLMIAAMKQCGRSRMPVLHPLCRFADWVKQAEQLPALRFIPHLDAAEPLSAYPSQLAAQEVLFAIGPEGDFTPQEVEQASAAGFLPVLMGNHRLRGETAAIYALSVVKGAKGY